ncbi:penicillin-insensitive murein endopeptidase [Citreicoccus inhibens]|uniref:penicillin-insensitive murein endopeptidase n=1 Tax=Citreicoccus inhibens TaxID=2849499 RepID=UPI002AA53BED|nr:LysM peptidoglycan-binding domain-containing protein [Citreicoccus inhibens]
MRYPYWLLLVCAGCAARVVSPVAAPAAVAVRPEAAAPAPESVAPPPEAAAPVSGSAAPASPASGPVAASATPAPPEGASALAPCTESAEALAEEDDDAESLPADAETDGEVGEMQDTATSTAPAGPVYTAELSDADLTDKWKKEPASLGSMSVGFVESGRMVNSVQFPQGKDWIVVSPELAWATNETVDALSGVIRDVRSRFPNAPPIRVNAMSAKEGGYIRPHKSHQNGRDVDLGFYYPTVDPVRARERERYIDVGLNWELVRTLVTTTDVQMILVDKRVQKVLYDYALAHGEDKAWLNSLFNAGPSSILKHARHHRDHFHVRFYNARAQELGRRVAPLLALQPEHNMLSHRVRSGDTLGAIALRYNSSVAGIKKASRMKNTFLRIGQVLTIPLRGPCTHCPIPPAMVLPPRRMPPATQAPAVAAVSLDGATTPSVAAPCTPVAPATVTVPAAGTAGLSTAR